LGQVALRGQWTVIYGAPNSGKTVIAIVELVSSIEKGVINPEHCYYINADDDRRGLITKLKLAEEHEFEMLTPGYEGFDPRGFRQHLRTIVENGHAPQSIIVLDTLNKFVNLMDKNDASHFGDIARQFIAKGGTLICLAHTNKKKSDDNKSIYGGVSDVVNDADCAYIIDVVDDSKDVRTVEFENIKNRGDVAKSAVYQYSTVFGQGYRALLDSVVQLDETKAVTVRDSMLKASSGEDLVISAITHCITEGITGKKKITTAAASRAETSQRRIEKILDLYTGKTWGEHYWYCEVLERGEKKYQLLSPPDDPEDITEI
jgi:hypothetical protein